MWLPWLTVFMSIACSLLKGMQWFQKVKKALVPWWLPQDLLDICSCLPRASCNLMLCSWLA